jgi:hypothetical protein
MRLYGSQQGEIIKAIEEHELTGIQKFLKAGHVHHKGAL